MIVHVYNPERILNGHSNGTKASSSSVNDGNKSSGKSTTLTTATKVPSLTSGHQQKHQVQEKQGFNRPPPSPKMLRQSLFKGPHSRGTKEIYCFIYPFSNLSTLSTSLGSCVSDKLNHSTTFECLLFFCFASPSYLPFVVLPFLRWFIRLFVCFITCRLQIVN